MVVKDFIKAVQDYYGLEYRQGLQLNLVGNYLNEKSDKYLTCLFSATVKGFSGQYKSLPDIAIFENLSTETYEIMEEQKRKQQIADLTRHAITDGDERDYTEEMKGLFANMDKKFKV